jgi:hypothetical protein
MSNPSHLPRSDRHNNIFKRLYMIKIRKVFMCPNTVTEGVLGSKDKAAGMNNFVTGCAIGEVDSPFASLSSSLLF